LYCTCCIENRHYKYSLHTHTHTHTYIHTSVLVHSSFRVLNFMPTASGHKFIEVARTTLKVEGDRPGCLPTALVVHFTSVSHATSSFAATFYIKIPFSISSPLNTSTTHVWHSLYMTVTSIFIYPISL